MIGFVMRVSIKHKCKSCLSENDQELETESDNETSRQVVNRLPAIKKAEKVQYNECNFASTRQCNTHKTYNI